MMFNMIIDIKANKIEIQNQIINFNLYMNLIVSELIISNLTINDQSIFDVGASFGL